MKVTFNKNIDQRSILDKKIRDKIIHNTWEKQNSHATLLIILIERALLKYFYKIHVVF